MNTKQQANTDIYICNRERAEKIGQKGYRKSQM